MRRPRMTHPLPQDYVTAIGEVVVQWAYFETEFDDTLTSFLLQHPSAARLVEHGIPGPFDKRLKLFRDSAAICFAKTPALVSRFHEIATEARTLRTFRDRLAHGRWATYPTLKSGEISSILRRRGSNVPIWDLPKSKLDAAAREIAELGCKLTKISEGGDLFPGWHDLTSREKSELRDFRRNNLPTLPTLGRLPRQRGSSLE